MERPSSNSPPPPVRRSQRSTAGRPANKYGDWDTRSSSSSSMSTRERRLAEASRQKQAADNELRRKELAILRMELELERNINECEHQDQLAKIEQDERADFLLAQPLTSDLNERIQQWIVEESTSAAPTPIVRRPKLQKVLRSEVTLPPSVNKTIDSRLDRGKHFESNCTCWQSQTAADCEKETISCRSSSTVCTHSNNVVTGDRVGTLWGRHTARSPAKVVCHS